MVARETISNSQAFPQIYTGYHTKETFFILNGNTLVVTSAVGDHTPPEDDPC